MTLIIENVKEEFLPATKAFVKAINAKCKVKEEEEVYTLKNSPAIAKIRNIPLSKKEEEQLKQEVLTECGLSNV